MLGFVSCKLSPSYVSFSFFNTYIGPIIQWLNFANLVLNKLVFFNALSTFQCMKNFIRKLTVEKWGMRRSFPAQKFELTYSCWCEVWQKSFLQLDVTFKILFKYMQLII